MAGHPAWIRARVVLRRHEAAPWHDANCSSNHAKLCSGMAGSMPYWGLQRKVHAAKHLPTACLGHNVPLSLIGLGSSRFICAADERNDNFPHGSETTVLSSPHVLVYSHTWEVILLFV